MDNNTRRESRIPRLTGAAAAAGSKGPLGDKVRDRQEGWEGGANAVQRTATRVFCPQTRSPMQLRAGSPIGTHHARAPRSAQQNTLPSKRRGAALDAVPEAKRATGRAAAVAGAKAGAAAAPKADAAAPPAGEESWEDIAARTGMTPEELLNRKLMFKKGTLPAKKLEEMAPVIKELK
jgi:hypothetical protein